MNFKKKFFFVVFFSCLFFDISNVIAQTVTVVSGTPIGSYSVSDLIVSTDTGVSGSLVGAVDITLSGHWSAADFLILKRAIKTNWDKWNNDTFNYTLNSVDMSGINSLNGDFSPTNPFASAEGISYLFNGCAKLTKVVMPKVIPDGPVSFFRTFNECHTLPSVDLSLFTNISAMNGVIRNCYELTSFILPSTENLYTEASGVSFNAAFQECSKLQSLDLSHFTSISDIGWLARDCKELEVVIFPVNNTYTGSVTFQNAFNGCSKLMHIYNLEGFTNVSNLITTFNGCSSLIEIKLGFDPNLLDDVAGTFDGINTDCYKWFITTPIVNDIHILWTVYYNSPVTKMFYGNFVLPLTVAVVSAPTTINVGTTHTFSLPAITQPYAVRVGEPIWRLIYNPNSDSPVTTFIEATGTTQNILFNKVGNYSISCGAKSPNGTTYWSTPTHFTVVGVSQGSYSLTVAAPSTSIIEVKDSEGGNVALSNPIVMESDGITISQFTQGVPGATYTVFQDGIKIETATMSQVPTYTAATGSHSSAPSENTVVELGTNLTLTEATSFNNLLTKVSCDETYKNTYSSVVNLAPIAVEDGLLVEVDLTACKDQWAYMSMPFDFDVTTGIRYLKDGVETVAVLDNDVYVSLYDPAKRAVNGEGTKNWTYVKSGVIKAGEGFLFAKETADVYKILALNPNSLDATDKKIELQFNKAAPNRTSWDTNWNFIGSPFTNEYIYRPQGDEPKFLYRRNDGNWAGGYELNYDAILGGETLYPYTPYLTQVWGDDQYLTLEVDNSAPLNVAARATRERNAFGLYLYKGDTQIDKVGWVFTPSSSRNIVLNEDAIKAGLGKNCMWTPFNGRTLIYNELPFEGERMTFDLNINADANSTAYKINMLSSTTEGHDIYIRETNSNTWHNLSVSDFNLPASSTSRNRKFEVSISKNRVVTATSNQQTSNVIVYSNNGVIFIDGLSSNDVVSLHSTSGVQLAEYSNKLNIQISNLSIGAYIVKIHTENEVVTNKILIKY